MAITSFINNYSFLSNFSPNEVIFENVKYSTVEHAFQAAKCFYVEDRADILACETPGRAKRMGREVDIRPDWESVKLKMMEKLVRYKFQSDLSLMQRLIATGDQELVEGNTWGDKFWGVCEGIGENHLGKILMKIRAEFKG